MAFDSAYGSSAYIHHGSGPREEEETDRVDLHGKTRHKFVHRPSRIYVSNDLTGPSTDDDGCRHRCRSAAGVNVILEGQVCWQLILELCRNRRLPSFSIE